MNLTRNCFPNSRYVTDGNLGSENTTVTEISLVSITYYSTDTEWRACYRENWGEDHLIRQQPARDYGKSSEIKEYKESDAVKRLRQVKEQPDGVNNERLKSFCL